MRRLQAADQTYAQASGSGFASPGQENKMLIQAKY
jgi:hypothetical protein